METILEYKRKIDVSYRDTMIPNEGDIFLEVGASVGNTIKYIMKYKPIIIAVEPNPDNIKELEMIQGQITLVRKAAWSSKSVVNLYCLDSHRARFHPYAGCKEVRVETDSLDNILSEYNIPYVDFIKIEQRFTYRIDN